MTPRTANAILEDYRAQVLRWNRQVNLVSRQDAPRVVDDLVQQCRHCLEALLAAGEPALEGGGRLLYIDLGSGGGLPGIVWHTLLVESGRSLSTVLVEPREKRAWFLERQNTLAGMAPFAVLVSRWGGSLPEESPLESSFAGINSVLISLKALHLTDSEVLAGLAGAGFADGLVGNEEIPLLITRFYPGGQSLGPPLVRDLGISEVGTVFVDGGLSVVAGGARVLQPRETPEASLVLSSYLLRSSS